ASSLLLRGISLCYWFYPYPPLLRCQRLCSSLCVSLKEGGFSNYLGTTMVGEGKVPYVRAKRRGNKTYYYLVESRRDGEKVRQRNIRYLGTEPPTKERLETILREVKK
ncbi:MAG: hypothetical protein ACE5IA_01090, partial [Dehalococcoidia bacterium]